MFKGPLKAIRAKLVVGIFRDHRGCSIVTYMEAYGCCTPPKVELLVVQMDLKMTRDLNIRKLKIKIDSKLMVGWLTSLASLNAPTNKKGCQLHTHFFHSSHLHTKRARN